MEPDRSADDGFGSWRLGDQVGAIYTPVAVVIAIIAWAASGEAVRFLAVLVIATPCPLLIAIPVGTLGACSLAGVAVLSMNGASEGWQLGIIGLGGCFVAALCLFGTFKLLFRR